MSRQGRELARQHGDKLPAFSSLEEAQHHWCAFRDERLALLSEIAKQYPDFHPDYVPESLRQLEQWYFHLYETDSFRRVGLTRETFEMCMAMYFGETVVRNTTACWVVEENYLAPGKYELGVRKDSVTMMLYRFADHFLTPNNKRKQSLFRDYQKYFSRHTPSDLDKELEQLLRQQKKISAVTLYQERKLCTLEEAREYIEALESHRTTQ
jgi:hypothetical protein